jgi:hypothetical protein
LVGPFAGHDGLDSYRRLASGLTGRMRDGAMALCEMTIPRGCHDRAVLPRLAREVSVKKDLATRIVSWLLFFSTAVWRKRNVGCGRDEFIFCIAI